MPHLNANRARERFLRALARSANVAEAARFAGVDRKTCYRWREIDPDFRAAWDEALGAGIDALEARAFERALQGNDTLAIFLLRAHKPEVYAARADVTVLRQMAADMAQMTDEDLEAQAGRGRLPSAGAGST